jgi:predicted RecA/RadA family phage recombinase
VATNEVYRAGTKISLPVPETIKSGDPVRVGAINAVAQTDAGVTGPPVVSGGVGNAPGFASVARDGAFNLTVTGALTVGQIVYITGANALTATSTGNKIFGVALSAKGAGAGLAIVELVQPGTDTAAA